MSENTTIIFLQQVLIKSSFDIVNVAVKYCLVQYYKPFRASLKPISSPHINYFLLQDSWMMLNSFLIKLCLYNCWLSW